MKHKKNQTAKKWLLIALNTLLYVSFLAMTLPSPFRPNSNISQQPFGLPAINYLPLVLLVVLDLYFLHTQGKTKNNKPAIIISALTNASAKLIVLSATNTIFYTNLGLSDVPKNILFLTISIFSFALIDLAQFAFLKKIGIINPKKFYIAAPLAFLTIQAPLILFNLFHLYKAAPLIVFEDLIIAVAVGLITLAVGKVFQKTITKHHAQ